MTTTDNQMMEKTTTCIEMPFGWWQIWQRYHRIFFLSLPLPTHCAVDHFRTPSPSDGRLKCRRIWYSLRFCVHFKGEKVESLFFSHLHKQTFVECQLSCVLAVRRSPLAQTKNADSEWKRTPFGVCTAFHWHGRLILSTSNRCSSALRAYICAFFLLFLLAAASLFATLLLFPIRTILSLLVCAAQRRTEWSIAAECQWLAEDGDGGANRDWTWRRAERTTTSGDKKGTASWLMNICKSADAIVFVSNVFRRIAQIFRGSDSLTQTHTHISARVYSIFSSFLIEMMRLLPFCTNSLLDERQRAREKNHRTIYKKSIQ